MSEKKKPKIKYDDLNNQKVKLIIYLSVAKNKDHMCVGLNGYIVNPNYQNTKSSDKPNKFTITDFGYVDNNQLALYKEAKPVVPSFFFLEYTSYKYTSTVDGYEKFFNFVKEFKSRLETNLQQVYTDNGDTFTSLEPENVYIYLAPGPMINVILEEAKETLSSYLEIDHKKTDEFISQRAQLFNLGSKETIITAIEDNINSNVGLNLSVSLAEYAMNHPDEHRLTITSSLDKRFWDIKKDLNPLIDFRQLFFIGNNPNTKVLSVMEYPTNVSVGKKTNEALFGLVKLNEVPEIIKDAMVSYDIGSGTYDILSILDLAGLYSQDNRRLLQFLGKDIYNIDNDYNMKSLSGDNIVLPMSPAGLATKVFNNVSELANLLELYLENHDKEAQGHYRFINVTRDFYNIEGDKYTMFLPMGTNKITLEVQAFDTTLKVPLELGIDTLTRNGFKALESKHPEIILMLEKDDKIVYYYSIVKTDDGIALYTSLFSNKIVL